MTCWANDHSMTGYLKDPEATGRPSSRWLTEEWSLSRVRGTACEPWQQDFVNLTFGRICQYGTLVHLALLCVSAMLRGAAGIIILTALTAIPSTVSTVAPHSCSPSIWGDGPWKLTVLYHYIQSHKVHTYIHYCLLRALRVQHTLRTLQTYIPTYKYLPT